MKKVLLVGVGLIVAIFGGLAVFIATLDVNQYKPSIIAAVEESTGRSFDIKGNIGVKPSVIPTLSVEGVSFGNPAWAAHDTMVTAERFEAQIELVPLLSGQISISRVLLRGARVVLETDRKGGGNWVLSLEEESEAIANDLELPVFDIQKITVKDALIEYRPYEADGAVLTIDEIDISTTGLGKPLNIVMNAQFNDIAFSLDGVIAPIKRLMHNEPYAVDLQLSTGDVAIGIAGSIAKPLGPADFVLDFEVSMPSTTALSDVFARDDIPALAPVLISGELHDGDDAYVIDKLQAVLGPSDLRGRIELEFNAKRPAITTELESKFIDLSSVQSSSTKASSKRVFSSAPLAITLLKELDVSASIAIGQLETTQVIAEVVRANARLNDGKLSIANLDAIVNGGTINGEMTIDASRKTPRFSQVVTVKGIPVAPFLNNADTNFASGGKADINVQITGEGRSPAEIMGNSDGYIRIDVVGLNLKNRAAGLASADVFVQIFDILNPLSKSDDKTLIECAVINFPIKNGTMQSHTGIGVSTRKLNILGGGSVDLKTEQLDIGVNPKPREGVGLNMSSLANFIRLGGTLSNPKPTTDAMGAATAGVKATAAFATGGLSILAEGLLDRASSDVDVCAIARGDQAPPTATKTAETSASKIKDVAGKAVDTTTNAIEGAGRAVKGVFKGLFGE